jgi:hypothetical protein
MLMLVSTQFSAKGFVSYQALKQVGFTGHFVTWQNSNFQGIVVRNH